VSHAGRGIFSKKKEVSAGMGGGGNVMPAGERKTVVADHKGSKTAAHPPKKEKGKKEDFPSSKSVGGGGFQGVLAKGRQQIRYGRGIQQRPGKTSLTARGESDGIRSALQAGTGSTKRINAERKSYLRPSDWGPREIRREKLSLSDPVPLLGGGGSAFGRSERKGKLLPRENMLF